MLSPFRKKKCPMTVGLQLSEKNISLMILDCSDIEAPVIKDYVNYSLNSNVSIESVTAEIKSYIADKNVSNANCCLVLDDKDYQIIVVEPPNVPEDEMVEAIRWKLKDLIQFSVNDVDIDVFIKPESAESNKNLADVVVVHKSIIDKKSQFVSDIGLQLMAIDIPEFAYRNYLETTPYHDSNVALVSIKQGQGKLMVLQKGNVYFSRAFSIDYNGGLFDDVPESDVVLELQRSLDYYERQLKQTMPTTVVFVGENLIDDKITDTTKNNLNQEVFVESLKGFNFTEEDSLASARVISTYGASLRSGLLTGHVL